MKPELIVIDTLDGLISLCEYLEDKEYVAYDCETTGLTKQDRVIGFSVCAEENKAFYVVLDKFEDGKLVPQLPFSEVRGLIIDLKSKQLLMHNATFDCIMAEAYFKISLIDSVHTDTMILAHLLNENRRVGLKELAKEYFGEDSTDEAKEMKASVLENGGKLTKTTYEMWKCDSRIMGKYGAKDAWLTYKLFYELVPELYKQGLEKFFYDDESMPLLRGPTYDLNNTGMRIDVQRLQTLKKTLQAESEEAKAFIFKEINEYIRDRYPGTTRNNTFNIGAPQQLSWLLFERAGIEFGTLTKAGKETCKALGLRLPYTKADKRNFIAICKAHVGDYLTFDTIVNGKVKKGKKVKEPWAYIAADKAILTKLAPKYKWIETLLSYQRKQKLLNTYICGIEDKIQYGVVTSSYLQHGTLTGRYSSRNPNLQNLPREDQRIKECYLARPGKVFVSADYSQLEPRIFSYYSQDQRLMNAFNGESDFYSVVGQDVYDKFDCEPKKEGPNSFGEKYKSLRFDSKTFALAYAYGATPNQLAPKLGKSVDETTDIMTRYGERFPGVKKMMLDAHDIVKKQGYVENIFGRRRRLPEALKINKIYGKTDHWDLPYNIRRILNMACNSRIQGTAGSLINRAAVRFYSDCKELNKDAKIVSQIHDEMVVECREEDADIICSLLRRAMETTNELPGVPLEAIPRVTRTLAK